MDVDGFPDSGDLGKPFQALDECAGEGVAGCQDEDPAVGFHVGSQYVAFFQFIEEQGAPSVGLSIQGPGASEMIGDILHQIRIILSVPVSHLPETLLKWATAFLEFHGVRKDLEKS